MIRNRTDKHTKSSNLENCALRVWTRPYHRGSNERFVMRKDAVDHSSVTRWFTESWSGCKYLDDQTSSSGPKTMDSEAVL